MIRSVTLFSSGQIDQARDDAQAAVEIARQMGNSWMLGFACMVRGQYCLLTGDLIGAREDQTTALTMGERLNLDILTAQAHTHLAWICMAESETDGAHKLDEARWHLSSQLEALERSRHLEGLGYALDTSVQLALSENRLQDAARALGAVRAIRKRPGVSTTPFFVSVHQAQVETVRQQLGSAAIDEIMDSVGEVDPWILAPTVLAATSTDTVEAPTR